MQKNSIRKRLTTAFWALSIGPLLLLAVILPWNSLNVQMEQATALQSAIARESLSKVLTYTNELESTLTMATNIQELFELPRERLFFVLYRLQSHNDKRQRSFIEELTMVDSHGQELAHVSRLHVHTEADLRNRSSAPEFRQPFNSGKVYYSPEYFNDRTGEPFMDVGIPILSPRTNEARGMLIATIRLKEIWSLVADVRIAGNGKAYIVNKEGRVLVHPIPSVLLRGETIPNFSGQGGAGADFDNTLVIRAVEEFRLGDQSFYMVAETPLTEAFGLTIRTVFLLAGLLLAVLIGAIVLGIYVARQIIMPIETLADTARSIAAGDYNKEAILTSHDEIGTLARAFNNMARQLVGTIQSLGQETLERKKACEEAATMKERGRLARELHDSVTQSLYSVTLFAETAKQLAAKGEYDRLETLLEELSQNSKDVLKELRLLVYDLRPAALAQDGFFGALRRRLDAVEQRSGVKTSLTMEGEGELATEIEEGLYGIAQEALNNALKHSSARHVEIRILKNQTKVRMDVSDDGVGFDKHNLSDQGGQGLISMEERAATLGGTLQVITSLAKGTTVSVELPTKT